MSIFRAWCQVRGVEKVEVLPVKKLRELLSMPNVAYSLFVLLVVFVKEASFQWISQKMCNALMNMHEGFNPLKRPAEACKHQSFCLINYSYMV